MEGVIINILKKLSVHSKVYYDHFNFFTRGDGDELERGENK